VRAREKCGWLFTRARNEDSVVGWTPRNFDEACKRHAGRRKLHIEKRKVRAERIGRLLPEVATSGFLRRGEYGCVTDIAEEFKVGVATASRDLALCRRMLDECKRVTGIDFDGLFEESIVFSWDYASYGFRVEGDEVVGRFLFSTRPSQPSLQSGERPAALT
jgi:hypothetical protein